MVLLLFLSTASTLAQTRLRLAGNYPVGSPTDEAMQYFADLVSERTDGEVVIELFPANQLGGNRELLEAVQLGAVDLQIQGTGLYANYGIDDFHLYRVFFAFQDQDHVYEIWGGPVGERLAQQMLDKAGVRTLSMEFDRMPRHIAANVPIRTPEDLQGQRIRCGGGINCESIALLGGIPVNIPLSEMYIALEQGVAEGAELPLDFFYDHSLYEVLDYLNLTYHNYDVQILVANERRFQQLPEEVQAVLQEAAAEAADYNNQLVNEQMDSYLQRLEEAGMEIVEADWEAFHEAMSSEIEKVYEQYPSTRGLWEELQALD